MIFDYRDSPYPIRPDIPAAHQRFWARLARPGSWWTGAERVAIASAVRSATKCEYCQQRRAALSPYTFDGAGQHLSEYATDDLLSPRAIDAVHRIVTDQGRITRRWVDDNADHGLSREAYVELAGIVVALVSIDEFHRALALPLEPLPEPMAGAPDGYRPAQARHDVGHVPMLPADGATGNEADLWQGNRTANVLRALSVVPDAVRAWLDLAGAQYLSIDGMGEFGQPGGRAINRMQMELVAGRVSSYNECFY
jgi:hypothetical protein